MSDPPPDLPNTDEPDLLETVSTKAARKLAARRDRQWSVLSGLGLFGLVGWAVSIPAILGIALGAWIDRRWPTNYSWTLMLLFVGVALGCANGWYWIQKESDRE